MCVFTFGAPTLHFMKREAASGRLLDASGLDGGSLAAVQLFGVHGVGRRRQGDRLVPFG